MFIGKFNKFGNTDRGTALVDKRTGKTLFKTGPGKAINFDDIKPSEKAEIIDIDLQREVYVLSPKMSQLVKDEILKVPGYRGLLI